MSGFYEPALFDLRCYVGETLIRYMIAPAKRPACRTEPPK
jgi:hypothetical protein